MKEVLSYISVFVLATLYCMSVKEFKRYAEYYNWDKKPMPNPADYLKEDETIVSSNKINSSEKQEKTPLQVSLAKRRESEKTKDNPANTKLQSGMVIRDIAI